MQNPNQDQSPPVKKESLLRRILKWLKSPRQSSVPKNGSSPEAPIHSHNNPIAAAAPYHPLTEEEKARYSKEQHDKQQEELKQANKDLKFLHGYNYSHHYLLKGPKQKILMGIGELGLHCRIVDKNSIEYEDEHLGIPVREEGDIDIHKSILKNSITDFTIAKERAINPDDTENPVVSWNLYIVYSGGRLVVPFPEENRQMAIELKRILWQWRNNQPIAGPEELTKLTAQYL